MREFYCKNEGPYCGCWACGWLFITDEATSEQI